MTDLTHLAIIWCSVYLAVIAADRTKLTPLLYYLAFGSIMVNVGILPQENSEFIRSFGEVGIILIMFALGFEENSQVFVNSIKRSWGIALFGAIAPFCTAFALAEYFWHDRNISIMVGLAMTATAVSLTMVSLKSENLHKSAAATGIMTSAVLDDIGSLALVAILVPVASGTASVSVASIAVVTGKALLFFVVVSAVGIWIFPKAENGWFAKVPLLGAFSFSDVLAFGEGEHATLTVLLLALATGLLSHEFGFHPAVGAYMAGLIIREEYFRFRSAQEIDHYAATKKIIDNVAFSWIGPVFLWHWAPSWYLTGTFSFRSFPKQWR